MTKVASAYHHVDNGGLTVDIVFDDYCYFIEIGTSTNGFGGTHSVTVPFNNPEKCFTELSRIFMESASHAKREMIKE